MSDVLNKGGQIKVIGKSWVIDLSDEFTSENNLARDTKVLLTFKEDEKVEAEILPPLSENLKNISTKLLKKRRKVFKELKRLGD